MNTFFRARFFAELPVQRQDQAAIIFFVLGRCRLELTQTGGKRRERGSKEIRTHARASLSRVTEGDERSELALGVLGMSTATGLGCSCMNRPVAHRNGRRSACRSISSSHAGIR